MSRKEDGGNGDTCPINAAHGHMYVLPQSDPPQQWCADQSHDGTIGPDRIPQTRAKWPLYGIEESVMAYVALAEQASRKVR